MSQHMLVCFFTSGVNIIVQTVGGMAVQDIRVVYCCYCERDGKEITKSGLFRYLRSLQLLECHPIKI